MNKNKLSILLIDRKKAGEDIVKDVFMKYGNNYGLLVFPPKGDDEESRIQIVFFNYSLVEEMERIFSVYVEYDPDDVPEFFDFDLTQISEEVFFEILETNYEISVFKLSALESSQSA